MLLSGVPVVHSLVSRQAISSQQVRHTVPAWKRGCPANLPPLSLMHPSSVSRLMVASLCRWPDAKSLGSCAGVILTAPVPKAMSTSSASRMTGILRLSSGCSRNLPCSAWYLKSIPLVPSLISSLQHCLGTCSCLRQSRRLQDTPWVVRVHRDRSVAQHGLWPRCGHNNLPAALCQEVGKGRQHPKLHGMAVSRHIHLGVGADIDVVHLRQLDHWPPGLTVSR